MNDSVIITKVKATVFKPKLTSAEINVEAFKRVVQLTGFVNSREDITKSVGVAHGVPGVKSVKYDMRLK